MKSAREAWSNDDTPAPEITMEEIITRAEKHRSKVRLSNALELAAGVFVVVVFVAMAALPDLTHLPALSRVGAAMIACATIFVLTYLMLRGAPRDADDGRDRSTLACYRDELERRRRLLASVVRWYLAPFWPGFVVFVAGIAAAHWREPAAMRATAFTLAFGVAVNVAIAWLNHRAARKLADELASLAHDGE